MDGKELITRVNDSASEEERIEAMTKEEGVTVGELAAEWAEHKDHDHVNSLRDCDTEEHPIINTGEHLIP
jgi:hypothetical protein